MSKRIRRLKKLNSDNDSLFVYEPNETAIMGSPPYSPEYEFSKNSTSYLLDKWYLDDNNYFSIHKTEGYDIAHTYQI